MPFLNLVKRETGNNGSNNLLRVLTTVVVHIVSACRSCESFSFHTYVETPLEGLMMSLVHAYWGEETSINLTATDGSRLAAIVKYDDCYLEVKCLSINCLFCYQSESALFSAAC